MKAKQDGAQKKAYTTDPIQADESCGCSQHPRAELFCLLLAHKYSKWGRNAVKMVRWQPVIWAVLRTRGSIKQKKGCTLILHLCSSPNTRLWRWNRQWIHSLFVYLITVPFQRPVENIYQSSPLLMVVLIWFVLWAQCPPLSLFPLCPPPPSLPFCTAVLLLKATAVVVFFLCFCLVSFLCCCYCFLSFHVCAVSFLTPLHSVVAPPQSRMTLPQVPRSTLCYGRTPSTLRI